MHVVVRHVVEAEGIDVLGALRLEGAGEPGHEARLRGGLLGAAVAHVLVRVQRLTRGRPDARVLAADGTL
jgi:hypothetical protein